jgi:hypothetical protein
MMDTHHLLSILTQKASKCGHAFCFCGWPMFYKNLRGLGRHTITPAIMIILISMISISAVAQPKSPFCADSNCTATRKTFKRICDLIVKKKSTYPVIYVGGVYMRDLVAGYKIFGDHQYLDTAIAYADSLADKQMANGFWGTGYGAVYLADTGQALALFMALYPYVDSKRQKRYFQAVKHFTTTIQRKGLIRKNGAFGVGWGHLKNGKLIDPMRGAYTVATSLTGSTVFTWMYHRTKKDKYRKIAYHAVRWILSTMRSDGNIPAVFVDRGADLADRGNPEAHYKLWIRHTFGVASYVGEGITYFDLYCENPVWKSWVEKAVLPNINFLLRKQRMDGTWSKRGRKTWDRTRSPGIVNYLIWYYENVYHDPMVTHAVRKFDAYVVNSKNGKYYGLLIDGATGGKNAFNTSTALTGRALAAILSPGVDTKW